MSLVLTLIVNPLETEINPIIDHIRNLFKHDGMSVTDVKSLSDGEAVDIYFSGYDLSMARQMINAALVMFTVDYAVQPVKSRKKKLFLADMDSTMITVECIDELADFANIRSEVESITEAAMRGELDFSQSLTRRVSLLKGLEEDMLQRCFDERVELMPGGRTVIQTMRKHGAYTALVSGGFTFFSGRVADALGFHQHTSNTLGLIDGKLTGTVIPPICDANTKLETLRQLKRDHHLHYDDVLAVGDGANDLPMIKEAGLGVAYHAKPVVSAVADASIHHSDLTALLFMQGYHRDEFSLA
ncbi:phosphoserine phosphatase SerB [Kordiimonas sediminis]|uniref:Phosphoserine phosphatase n=1 Tax=Kordiimonas sediminis TaxID=1735581 RepID=A0A919AXR6_9PROT|nr:phosphoserine phosphatase SerB [Kordiimonas sediminis]GHF30704.1 phosphoserine phosphatase SerB [Kordiimonas sediminis]